MTTTYKVLGQSAPGATTETDLYTVPTLTSAIASSIIICNRGSSSTTFRVSIAVGGGATGNKDYLYYDIPIAGNDTFIATIGITLAAADKVKVYAGNANLSFNLFGQEIS
jgi:hypothetical protein